MRRHVHDQIPDRMPLRLIREGRAADQRLYPRAQFTEGEGLDQIVVRTRIQTVHAVVHRAQGSQHQHGGFQP
ncbi:hypothetical protein D3C87_1288040 [compost metagenome]